MDDQPPLIWPQFESTEYTRRRSPIPSMLVPVTIGVISAATFLLFVTFVVPPFLSITSQILQPASVKRGWDSINVVIVVFAILCGVLARRNDDGLLQSSHGEETEGGAVTIGEMTVGEDSKIISSPSEVSSQQWFDDVYEADRFKIYESVSSRSFSHSHGLPVTGTLPLRRSSSSYPDLRNGVHRDTGDRRFRFYDDFEIDKYRSHDSRSYEQFPNRSKIEIEEEESEPKEILVDKFVVKPSSPPPQPPQQPPTAPPPPIPPPRASPVEVSHKPRKTHRSVRNREISENAKRSDTKFKRAFVPPPSPPPPPPPPPPPFVTATPPRKVQGTLQRRKSNAAKEIKMVFASLYNQGKKKKKLQKLKRKERIESPVVVMETEPPQYKSLIPPPSPPPPPPPPPPPLRSSQSVFYGLFKKGAKNKKIHSVPVPPPPPPPRKIQFDPQTPPRRVKSGRPPRPTKPTSFNDENNGQGSPSIQTTPPPPPPLPFTVPPLKFVVSGDFAKIRSNQSSRCSSPEREVIDLGWGLELTQSEGGVETNVAVGSGGGSGFCPSPDVNMKADNFIARLRDEWRLDKINSVNKKR